MRVELLAALAAALAGACIAPSVLDESQRAVAPRSAPREWVEPSADDLLGLHESVAIEGEVAAALWKVWYHFASDGTYTGAALVLGAENPEFQTLTGRWTLDAGALDLGQGQRVLAQASGAHLRLESDGGVVIFRASEVR